METCVVGCKLPHGLAIDLIEKKGNAREKIPDVTKRFVLKGANAARIMGGYGITAGVPKEQFVAWLTAHARTPYVMSGSVFMVNDEASARDRAREGSKERTGFEAIDPTAKNVAVEPEDSKVYAQQKAANPDRNRQIDELQQ